VLIAKHLVGPGFASLSIPRGPARYAGARVKAHP
jgi:hypothetical protein